MVDIMRESVRFAMSELAREGITPDINWNDPAPLIELELVDMVALYNGREVAQEAKRLFVQDSLHA